MKAADVSCAQAHGAPAPCSSWLCVEIRQNLSRPLPNDNATCEQYSASPSSFGALHLVREGFPTETVPDQILRLLPQVAPAWQALEQPLHAPPLPRPCTPASDQTPSSSPASSSALSSSARAPAVLAHARRALRSSQMRLPAAGASSLPAPSLQVLGDVSPPQCLPQTRSRP